MFRQTQFKLPVKYTKIFKRRQNKTADQVAKNIIQLHVNESSTSEFYNKKIILIKTKDAKGNLKSIPVTFFNKKTYIEIDGDGYTIHPKGIIGRSKTHNNLKVGSKLSTEVESDHVINFHEFVTNKHARDLVMNFLDKLNTDSPITYEMVDQFDEGITEIRTNAPLSPISCTPDELRQWISILNECQRKLMAKDPVYYDKSYSSEILQDALYRIKDLFTDITIGANILSSEIAGMFLVDAQYENTINDVETLSTFVGGMINAGIPSSYVGYNTWFVMSDKFDDKEVFINFDDESVLPRWGHTRIVFYPSDIFLKTKVMKIALNASGIAANKREMQISKNYKNIPYVLDDDRKVIDIIAKTEYISQNECITICERIIPEYNVDEANTLKATTVNIAKVLGHTLQITDVHGGNVGYIITPDDRKQWKILDYGGSLIRS